MNIVIVGCGRVGAFLAGLMDLDGHAVTVVDKDRASFAHLPQTFKGATLLGDGVDLDLLRKAGTEKADAFLSLTDGDNRNLMAAQIAQKIFGVKQVLAKVNDPIRARMYREQGIPTISRTTILGTLLHAMLTGNKEIGPKLVALANKHEDEMSGGPEAD
ncbi:MAG: TrkA family potassium uptake protein [Chloroflexi bacterium]|nr:TrkA family potassium uptake protein [Chloroflexota bacterium]